MNMILAASTVESTTNWMAFHPAIVVALLGIVVAVYGTIAERRRAKRKDIDKVGFMPWRFIVFAGMFTAMVMGAVALRP